MVRADLDWLDEGGAALVKQVEAAARAVESSSFVVLGYTENPDEHSERLVRLASEIRGTGDRCTHGRIGSLLDPHSPGFDTS